MSLLRLILLSLLHHWRMNVAVACGVAVGTAVLTGALLVGDSMRGSLRRLTFERLGRVDEVLATPRFFRQQLAAELAAQPGFKSQFAAAVPAIMLRASLENANPNTPRRVNRVNLFGCDKTFWKLDADPRSHGPAEPPGDRQIVLTRPVAEMLGVGVGDAVLLRLPRPGTIPADSPLGRKEETVDSYRLSVGAIIPAEGVGRFDLRPSQRLPRNAFVSLAFLQTRLGEAGRVNTILVAGGDAAADPTPQSDGIAQRLLRPKLDDYGLRVERSPRGYFNITSDRMLLEPATAAAVLKSLDGLRVQPALTYLANTIACGDRAIPYSTIAAVDLGGKAAAEPPWGPFRSPEGQPIGPIGDGQIVLNSWAADQLKAKPGDTIRVDYFAPEATHGQLAEQTASFRLAAVVELAGAADDRDFTPAVPGVTDQLSMADWDPPFPFDAKRIRKQDEKYWDDHGPTPKAFVSLAEGQRLWGSRFGRLTSLRVQSTEGLTLDALRQRLAIDPAEMGFTFQPVKRQGLAASAGTTPFDVLFLAFSFFIIAAAVMLVALLFRLGIDLRAAQLGILVAVGLRRRKIAALLAGEGLVIAMLGSLLGVPVGVGYAALMLLGLRTWWVSAVATPFLRLYVTPLSLLIGFASGVVVALLAIVWAVWRTRRIAPRQLLAGQAYDTLPQAGRAGRYTGKLAAGMLIGAIALGLFAGRIDQQEARAGAFFGAGALVLIALLMLAWLRLKAGSTGPAVAAGRGNLLRLALRNAARNPGRSTLTVALIASACFLIVAVSAFHVDPTEQTPTRNSGNGGFALVAESDQPIYYDPGTPQGRAQLGFSADDAKLLADAKFFPLRVNAGDDASCLNLYRPRQPRVLGLPKSLLQRGGFAFASSAATTLQQRDNPWLLLEEELPPEADGRRLTPVVLDMNTAMYSLHVGLGDVLPITDGRGKPLGLKVVGLLAGGIFQGDLLIGESAFLRHFPEVSGYRVFLVECPPQQAKAIGGALETTLGDYGLAAETTGARMAALLAVQNTYLSTFQSLGGLGLLLGTFGLAAVQLRGVLERRGELALLRAAGFRRATLAAMVTLENGLLLIGGLAVGLLAALVAVLPHLLSRAASIPWPSLAGTLALVLLVGLLAGLSAVRAALRAPLLGALREEH